MIAVELTWIEVWLASEIGKLRQYESLRKNLKHKYGFEGVGWDIHIDGSGGEMAVAKALGIYYGGSVNTFKTEGDIGNLEVRTRSKSDYELLVRPDDNDEAVFVHVTGTLPKFKVHGWLKGKDAKQPKWLQDYGNRPPAYFVPNSALQPIEELKIKNAV